MNFRYLKDRVLTINGAVASIARHATSKIPNRTSIGRLLKEEKGRSIQSPKLNDAAALPTRSTVPELLNCRLLKYRMLVVHNKACHQNTSNCITRASRLKDLYALCIAWRERRESSQRKDGWAEKPRRTLEEADSAGGKAGISRNPGWDRLDSHIHHIYGVLAFRTMDIKQYDTACSLPR